MKWLTGTVIFLAAMGFVVAADKLLLKDGQTVTGKILSLTANDVQIQTETETIRVPRWAIDKIEREGGDDPRAASRAPQGTARAAQHDLPHRIEFESTPALEAWIATLVEQLASTDNGVRSTAAAALRAAGPVARDAVQGAAEGDNQNVARIAKRVLTHIDFGIEQKSAATGSPHDRDHVGELMAAMKVTDEQTPRFKEVMSEFYTEQSEIAAAIRDKELSVADGGKQIKDLRAGIESTLATILTEEQLQIFAQQVPWAAKRGGDDAKP